MNADSPLAHEASNGERDSRPRVLFLSAVGGAGGPVQSLFDVLQHLVGYERIALGPWSASGSALLGQGAVDRTIQGHRPQGVRAFARSVALLRSTLKSTKPDLIHANGLTEAAVAAFALASLPSCRAPLAVWTHNSEVPRMFPLAAPLLRSFGARVGWTAVSQFASSMLRDAGIRSEIQVIFNPIANRFLAEREPAGERVRVAYLGSDRNLKGFDLLPPLIESTRHAGLDWLLFTGRGKSPCWQQIDLPSLKHVGRVTDVRKAYARCNVVFVPSRTESFCRVAAEAMLNGLPVVATDLPALREVLGVPPGAAGLTFPMGDIGQARARLLELAGDPGLRERLGALGRERARIYEPSHIGALWDREYRRLLGRV